MTAQAPTKFISGVGAASADNLNSFVQVVYNLATLRNFSGQANMLASVLGGSAPSSARC